MFTWVTGFFDLGKRGLGGNKSLSTYLEQAENLLKQDIYLYIFIEPDLADKILSIRQKYNLQNKTYIVKFNFEDLPFYQKYFEIASTNLKVHPLSNG